MSEEDINIIENFLNYKTEKCLSGIEILSISKLLNAYREQQKEIEEYKKIVECVEEFKRLKRPVMELVHEMNKFEDEFISKDKVREVFSKEREKALERFDNHLDCSERRFKKNIQVAMIDTLLKKLLEEKEI